MKIACAGDSITAGQTVAPNTSSYPVRLAAADRHGHPLRRHRLGPTGAKHRSHTAGHQVGVGRTVGQFGYLSSTNVNNIIYSETSGPAATFTSDKAGTLVERTFQNNNSGALTYAIDGGSAVTYTPTSASSVSKVTVTGLSNTTHTIVFTTLGKTSTYVGVVQVRGTSGALVSNWGAGGSTLPRMLNTAAFYQTGSWMRTADTYDVVIIEAPIINQYFNSSSAAPTQTDRDSLVEHTSVSGPT